ncbi:MAG TPA: aldo/keto reductase [Terriglobales bacterium]|nr:aldo/keto reductase [Terriglobales bacterium]
MFVERRVTLGKSPLSVVPLGVGCWAWGDERFWRYDQSYGARDVLAAFTASISIGLDLFDTAEAYGWGKSERLLGRLRRSSPRPLAMATKYAPLAGRGGPAAIAKALAASRSRLGVESLDLYQLHWADRDEVPIEATMEVLADAVERGEVRAVGVSNFRAAEMRQAHAALARRGVPLASNQVRYSLLDRSPEDNGVLAACDELEVTLLAYSPLAQGLLTGKYSPAQLPSDGRAATSPFQPGNVAAAAPLLEVLAAIATARRASPAAVALAWLLAKPGVVPIAGAKDALQVRNNAQALHLRLDDGELARLDLASASCQPEKG